MIIMRRCGEEGKEVVRFSGLPDRRMCAESAVQEVKWQLETLQIMGYAHKKERKRL